MSEPSTADIYGYETQPIDIDRGMTIRTAPSGEQVLMYKSMPGLYLDPMGRVAPDARAAAAGFNVDGDRREARTRAEVRKATEAILARTAEVEHEIRSGLDQSTRDRLNPIADLPVPLPPVVPAPRNVTVTQSNAQGEPRATNDFGMKHLGGGKWVVVASDTGEPVTEQLTTEDAVAMLLALQAEADAEAE